MISLLCMLTMEGTESFVSGIFSRTDRTGRNKRGVIHKIVKKDIQ